jgi:hypothetical protein
MNNFPYADLNIWWVWRKHFFPKKSSGHTGSDQMTLKVDFHRNRTQSQTFLDVLMNASIFMGPVKATLARLQSKPWLDNTASSKRLGLFWDWSKALSFSEASGRFLKNLSWGIALSMSYASSFAQDFKTFSITEWPRLHSNIELCLNSIFQEVQKHFFRSETCSAKFDHFDWSIWPIWISEVRFLQVICIT